jgi:hypothetical protein
VLLTVVAATSLTAARCGIDPEEGPSEADMNAGARSYRTGREPAPALIEEGQVKHDDKDVPPAPTATGEPGAVQPIPGTATENPPAGSTPPAPTTPPAPATQAPTGRGQPEGQPAPQPQGAPAGQAQPGDRPQLQTAPGPPAQPAAEPSP